MFHGLAQTRSERRRIVAALALPLLVATCGGVTEGSDPSVTYPTAADCDRLVADTKAERVRVRQCQASTECGQLLSGEGCGCSRTPVVRLDADLTKYLALKKRVGELQCKGLAMGSICDCPAADGFACVDGACSWNYRR